MRYIKQLDSIRAVAILLVLIAHWVPSEWMARLNTGSLGVDMFFVLSGFLISWILLANRERAEKELSGKRTELKNFYIRRTLRIFPIYYLLIFSLLFFHDSTASVIDKAYPYYLTYTTNFYFFSIRAWDPALGHLWSLAVEEQFYLIWPTLMLFVSRKYLKYVIYGFIIIGVSSQLFLRGVFMIQYLTFSCFDSFGLGALLAWYLVYEPGSLGKFYKFLKIPALFGLALFVTAFVQTKWPRFPMLRTGNSLIALFILTYIIYKERTGNMKFGFILNSRVMIFIGKISYGIYLYHGVLPHYISLFAKKFFHVDVSTLGTPVLFLINSSVVLLVSWLSWKLIEKPILSLKKYFEYDKNKVRGAEPVAVNNLVKD
jgi:peptidoglycan/LPS O-acetylase OafA/YrhL